MRHMNLSFKSVVLIFGLGFALLLAGYLLVPSYSYQVLFSVIKTLLLVGNIFIQGFFCLRMFGKRSGKIDFVTAFAMGLMLTAGYFFLAGFLKLLVPPVLLLYYLLPLPMLWVLYKNHQPDLKHTLFSFFKRSPWEYPVFFLPFLFTLVPATFYDTLVYHLGIPNLYLQHGGFIETGQFMYANAAIYYEVLLIPVVFAGELVPGLFHFCLGMICVLAAADFAVEFLGIRNRVLLIWLLVSMPMSVFLLSTIKNDLPGALFLLIGVAYLLRNRAILSALFCGFAIGIKYFNALPLLIFLPLLLIKTRKPNPRTLLLSRIGLSKS